MQVQYFIDEIWQFSFTRALWNKQTGIMENESSPSQV